jgi:hypothetical protein
MRQHGEGQKSAPHITVQQPPISNLEHPSATSLAIIAKGCSKLGIGGC